jgi:archaeosortase B (VPXXXP-CTERM-specific)
VHEEISPAEAGPSPEGGFLRRYGALAKHWAFFLVILGGMVAINQWRPDWVNIHLSKFTARIMAGIMDLLGTEGKANGIYIACTVCRFKIIGECTGYYPISIYLAAVLSFPTPWIRRILGVVLGIPTILVINQVRLVSLCYIDRSFPEHFEVIHIVVWQSLIIFLTVLVWILWVTTLARRP